ncbi:hypothetical protein [uncultured Desulfovibrio sp.]|uniref:hypothetical protein n=1 Tax=uncultured Desulfovibrio sp. TaxID=167968 RepID=UPI0026156015|nr:hypothetical protein [uncultured Desulfovibrio sp.]
MSVSGEDAAWAGAAARLRLRDARPVAVRGAFLRDSAASAGSAGASAGTAGDAGGVAALSVAPASVSAALARARLLPRPAVPAGEAAGWLSAAVSAAGAASPAAGAAAFLPRAAVLPPLVVAVFFTVALAARVLPVVSAAGAGAGDSPLSAAVVAVFLGREARLGLAGASAAASGVAAEAGAAFLREVLPEELPAEVFPREREAGARFASGAS